MFLLSNALQCYNSKLHVLCIKTLFAVRFTIFLMYCTSNFQRNVCTEAGMFAIRAERDFVIDEDFNKGVRKVAEAKKLEGSTHSYKQH